MLWPRADELALLLVIAIRVFYQRNEAAGGSARALIAEGWVRERIIRARNVLESSTPTARMAIFLPLVGWSITKLFDGAARLNPQKDLPPTAIYYKSQSRMGTSEAMGNWPKQRETSMKFVRECEEFHRTIARDVAANGQTYCRLKLPDSISGSPSGWLPTFKTRPGCKTKM